MHSRILTLSILALLLLVASVAQAQIVLSNFNATGPDYVYGGLAGTQGSPYVDITGYSRGGAVFGDTPPADLTNYGNSPFAGATQTVPNHRADIRILIATNAAGPANDYIYYYGLPASAYDRDSFSTGYNATLIDPLSVLEPGNGAASLGSESAFALDLSQATEIRIQGAGVSSSVPFDFRYDTLRSDNFAIPGAFSTPEPGVVGLLFSGGVVGIGVLRRRRSRR